MPDPFAKFRACSCLSCELILTVLDRQCEAHRTGWKTNEVLHALAGCLDGIWLRRLRSRDVLSCKKGRSVGPLG